MCFGFLTRSTPNCLVPLTHICSPMLITLPPSFQTSRCLWKAPYSCFRFLAALIALITSLPASFIDPLHRPHFCFKRAHLSVFHLFIFSIQLLILSLIIAAFDLGLPWSFFYFKNKFHHLTPEGLRAYWLMSCFLLLLFLGHNQLWKEYFNLRK